MRKPTPAYLVTSVVIALGGSVAFAQSATTGRATLPSATATIGIGTAATAGTTRGSMVNSGTLTRTPNGSTTTANVNGGTTTANANGSTTTTNRNGDGTFTTVTRNSDGTVANTITTNGAPTRDANGVLTNDTTTGTSVTTPNSPNTINPVVNGAVGGVTAEGERLLDERDRALQIDRSTVSGEAQAQPGTALADVQRSTVSLDRVIKSAEKDRKKIGRNGQLLNTIAPRTNVDRSNEMPDDGPNPGLSGLINSLNRR